MTHHHLLPPLVLAPNQQRKVEENPEQKAPSYRDPQAIPLAQVGHSLLPENVRPGSHASRPGNPHAQSLAHAIQKLQLQSRRDRNQRCVVENLNTSHKTLSRVLKLVLQNTFVGVLH